MEPGASDRYHEVQNILSEMTKTTHTGSTAWVLFIAETLDWLGLRADYDEAEYRTVSSVPWPHSFIAEDMVRAFATMAMFFPGVDEASLVHEFLGSSQWDSFRESDLFKPRERSRTLPDTRRRTSFKYREDSFWHPWWKFFSSKPEGEHWAEAYPYDWSLAIRPIIAQCKSGFLTSEITHLAPSQYTWQASSPQPPSHPTTSSSSATRSPSPPF
jgi:hypothetical protein